LKTQKGVARMESLLAFLAQAFSETEISLQKRFYALCELLVDYFHIPRCCVFTKEDESFCLLTGYPPEHHQIGLRVSCHEHLPLKEAAEGNGKVVVIEDIATDPRLTESMRRWAEASGTKSIVFVPVFLKKELLGIITLDIAQERGLSEEEINLLTFSRHYISVLIRDTRRFEEIKRLNRNLRLQQQRIAHSARLAALSWAGAKIAHQVRNALTPIGGLAGMLKGELESQSQKEGLSVQRARECIKTAEAIEQETKKLEESINSFLGFVEQRSRDYPFSLNVCLKRMMERLNWLNDEILFENTCRPSSQLFGDPELLFEIFEKMLKWAKRILEKGERDNQFSKIKIWAGEDKSRESARILISLPHQDWLSEEEKEEIEEILMPFTTGERVEEEKSNLVYELLDFYEGLIAVFQEENRVVIKIELPLFVPEQFS